MANTQTEESPTSPLNANDIVEKLAQADFLSGLLADPDVKAALLGEIRELGFRPPLHYVVLRLITALVAKSESFIGKAISSRLQAFIDHTPLLAGLLQRLITIQHGKETNDALKTSILAALTEGKPFDINAIEIDSTTPIETMLALHNVQGFERVLDGLDGQTDTLIRTFREDISNLFQNMVAPALSWPPEVLSPKGAFDRVKYTSGLDQLYGRDKEITLLHQFAGDLSLCGRLFNFRWMLLTGDGGTGKTRLAYDFTRKHLNQHIWDAGRLSIDDLPGFNDLEKWRPRQPTFIVIDYVSGHPEKTGKLLRILARKAAHYDFPVRILLLERKADESWLGKMLPEDGDKPMVMNHIFGHEDENGRTIPPVDATAITEMMRDRFAKAGQTPPDGDLLLAAAQRVDTRPNDANLPRPLFALATAEAMIAEAEKEPEAQPDFAKIAALLNQEDVLAGMLRREEHTRWRPAAPNDGGGTLTRYKLALALATLRQGLDLNDFDTKEEDYGSVARYLPDPPPDHHQRLISALGGSNTFLPPLQPDIMGEFFLAQTLLKDIPKQRHRFLNAVLANGSIRPVITLLRLLQDFPQKIEEIDILTAIDTCTNENAAFFYAFMSPSWVHLISYETSNAHASINFFLCIKNLTSKFPKNEKIFEEIAKAAFNIIIIFGKNHEWDMVNMMFKHFDDIYPKSTKNIKLATIEAQIAQNIINYSRISSNWGLVEEMFNRIDVLRNQFSSNLEIISNITQAVVYVIGTAGESGEWKLVDTTFERIKFLREKFGDISQIAEKEAESITYIIGSAGKSGDWKRVKKMLKCMDALRSKFNNNPKIAVEDAKSSTNITSASIHTGNCNLISPILNRIDTLLSQFPNEFEITLISAKFFLNVTNIACQNNDWKTAKIILQRIDDLCIKFHSSIELEIEKINAIVNITQLAAKDGNNKFLEEMLKQVDTIREKYTKDRTIATREAQIAFNIILCAKKNDDWELAKKNTHKVRKHP